MSENEISFSARCSNAIKSARVGTLQDCVKYCQAKISAQEGNDSLLLLFFLSYMSYILCSPETFGTQAAEIAAQADKIASQDEELAARDERIRMLVSESVVSPVPINPNK